MHHDFMSKNILDNCGFPGVSDGKESASSVGGLGSIPGLGRSPGEGKSFWPGKFHGLYSLWVRKDWDMIE